MEFGREAERGVGGGGAELEVGVERVGRGSFGVAVSSSSHRILSTYSSSKACRFTSDSSSSLIVTLRDPVVVICW